MKTSLDNLRWVEDCLMGRADSGELALFEAKLLLDPALREACDWQRKTYALIREYGREQFRMKLERIHDELFTEPQHRPFRERVIGMFRR